MLVDGGGIASFGAVAQRPGWTSARMWFRPTCGTARSASWTWWRSRTRMRTISEVWPPFSETFTSKSYGRARHRKVRNGSGCVKRPSSLESDCPAGRRKTLPVGGAAFETLAPVLDYIPDSVPRNNDSLVLTVSYGERSLILSGDMEKQIESELVGRNRVAHADVLKVAHHGSKTSTTVPFLDRVHPAFAVISAGFENLYGHPHRDIIEGLTKEKSESADRPDGPDHYPDRRSSVGGEDQRHYSRGGSVTAAPLFGTRSLRTGRRVRPASCRPLRCRARPLPRTGAGLFGFGDHFLCFYQTRLGHLNLEFE